MSKQKYFHRNSKLNLILDLDETVLHTYMLDGQHIIPPIIEHHLSLPENLEIRSRVYTGAYKYLDINDKVDSRNKVIEKEYILNNVTYWGIVRPYTRDFLSFCNDYFQNVIIWTAGSHEYADHVVKFLYRDLKTPTHVFSRNFCEKITCRDKDMLHKPIRKFSEIPELADMNITAVNTVVIDNNETTFQDNAQNAIHIPDWAPKYGNWDQLCLKDDCLLEIMKWLNHDEVRNAPNFSLLDRSRIFNHAIYK